ncbi:DnaD domain protein [Companilactobacillus baiquanensis]|uniref:DnaD domain protein n=1 Tax=Companilactobacillus baiquanensis TaxID=2486005 RepID=A0ABW1US15_9LACO|nr:DnaD domain protein [Companilactobacillus baiquanensis]
MDRDNNSIVEINPLTGYWCLPHGQINDYDRHILTDLYLPLLGTAAYSVYLLLWEKIPNKEVITDRKKHSDLLSLLNIDLNKFNAARVRAEALGLIRTFTKQDDLGEYCVYQLFEPLTPKEFFKDDLMSIFLYEKIGQVNYSELISKYSRSEKILENSTEITKDFLEVFQLNNDDLINTPAEVKKGQNEFSGGSDENKPKVDSKAMEQLDWELIEDRIGQLYKINPADLLQNQELIINLHLFYGVNEIALIDLIGKTANIVDNKIDPVRLRKAVQDRFEKNANITVKETVQPETNAPVTNNLSRADNLLLQQAKSMVPADFLAAEKQKSGGFTGAAESKALRDMAMKTYLSPAVLNILVDYILQNSPTLSVALMETVANDWQQNQVKTPEDALKRLRDFQNRPRNTRRYNNRNKKVEKATDWSKVKSNTQTDDKNAQVKRQELQARLRKMRNKDN